MADTTSSESAVAEARAVVALLARLGERPLTAGEAAQLEAMRARHAELKWPNGLGAKCPDCGMEMSPLDEEQHPPLCPRHPARLRSEALTRIATRLGATDLLTRSPDVALRTASTEYDFRNRVEFRAALDELRRERPSGSRTKEDAVGAVVGELGWRLRALHPELHPCPWCGGVVAVDAQLVHLRGCQAHPCAQRANVLHDALEERLGRPALAQQSVFDREWLAASALRTAVRACGEYGGSMGYEDGEHWYTKVYSERPWRHAMTLAEVYAKAERATAASAEEAGLLDVLVLLCERSLGFWNRMSDGDRGKSVIDREECTEWEAQVAEAEAALPR